MESNAAVKRGHFHFGVERVEGGGAIGGRQGVRDIAAKRGDVAHLRPADHVTRFD